MSSGTHSSGGSSSAGPHLVPVGMALTPKVLLKRHKLPVAAHLHMPAPPPGLDLSRPLMLYKTYNSTKVSSRSRYLCCNACFAFMLQTGLRCGISRGFCRRSPLRHATRNAGRGFSMKG